MESCSSSQRDRDSALSEPWRLEPSGSLLDHETVDFKDFWIHHRWASIWPLKYCSYELHLAGRSKNQYILRTIRDPSMAKTLGHLEAAAPASIKCRHGRLKGS